MVVAKNVRIANVGENKEKLMIKAIFFKILWQR
jgi:hypothetical protein